MLSKGKIALIYFSRSPKSEAEHKCWSSHSTKNQRLAIAKFLNQRSLSILKKSKLDIIHLNEENQVGFTFGERIANAFQHAYDLGYDYAISVGNDCFHLDRIDFSNITSALKEGHAVVGPTFRKGAYLIAMSRGQFNHESFRNLSWQSSNLEEDLITYFLCQCCPLNKLEKLRDINELKDFKRLLSTVKYEAQVIKKLRSILSAIIGDNGFSYLLYHTVSYRSFCSLRGPPLLG